MATEDEMLEIEVSEQEVDKLLVSFFFNDTHLIVRRLHTNVGDCNVVRKGKRVLISQIIFAPDDTNLPFKLKRVQFPLRLTYVLTINYSQGQTSGEIKVPKKNMDKLLVRISFLF